MPHGVTLRIPYCTAEINVQYRCPIPLAFTPHRSNLASYGNLPQSAIFFASQFRRLRELSTKYKLAIRGRQAGPQRAFGRRDEQDLLHQIYQVLLSSALYMAIMLGWKDGVEKLGFGAEEWIVTYETGEQQGSEMFGVREGLELNGSFLLGHLKEFKLWEKAGPLWWCPGQDQGDMRHRLETALGDMQAQLLDIYEEIVSTASLHWLISVKTLTRDVYSTISAPPATSRPELVSLYVLLTLSPPSTVDEQPI